MSLSPAFCAHGSDVIRYVTVDYERRNFSIAQAIFPEPNAIPDLVAISPAPGEGGYDGKLSTGAIAGIAVGGAVLLVLLLVGFWWRRRRAQDPKANSDVSRDSEGFTDLKPELHGVSMNNNNPITKAELATTDVKAISDVSASELESPGDAEQRERLGYTPVKSAHALELPGDYSYGTQYGSDSHRSAELAASTPRTELDGSNPSVATSSRPRDGTYELE